MAIEASVNSESTNQNKQQAYLKKKNSLLAQLQKNNGESVGLKKESSNLFRHRHKKNRAIDVRPFNAVIAINQEEQVAEVEGMTTYATLVDKTLKYGFLPTVVPELKSITIGGALSGLGIESASFRYGLVHETISEYEILFGDGKVITATADNQYKNLYYAFPNSYGTLGYALKLKVKLIPAKKYVHLEYLHFNHAKDYFERLKTLCLSNHTNGDIDFIDGVIFSKNKMVIMLARFVDQAPYTSNYKYMKIFYRSLLKRKEDYLTTKDYIWRWDTDWFWCSKVFGLQNPILRFLLGKWTLKSTFYWKMMRAAKKNPVLRTLTRLFEKPSESVIQDVLIPIENAPDFLNFFQEEIGISPIWNCPSKAYSNNTYDLFKMDPNKLYINFGFWDMIRTNKEPGYYNRLIEKKVVELGGNKSLYSNAYYSEQEFWNIYNKPLYEQLKQQYDPMKLHGNLYDKCVEKS